MNDEKEVYNISSQIELVAAVWAGIARAIFLSLYLEGLSQLDTVLYVFLIGIDTRVHSINCPNKIFTV